MLLFELVSILLAYLQALLQSRILSGKAQMLVTYNISHYMDISCGFPFFQMCVASWKYVMVGDYTPCVVPD